MAVLSTYVSMHGLVLVACGGSCNAVGCRLHYSCTATVFLCSWGIKLSLLVVGDASSMTVQ
jgi:hypothetical protein